MKSLSIFLHENCHLDLLSCQFLVLIINFGKRNLGREQGPVVRKAVSGNPRLKVQLGFDFSCIKAYIRANVL